MPSWQVYQWSLWVIQLLFVFSFGACVGSLTNVIVYRMPLGISIVSPPSRCPSCGTRLTWRENIPVFGWIFLRGRCRFCQAKVSPEYPIVEAAVGLLFAGFFALWYIVPDSAGWLGAVKPEWARSGLPLTWPAFLVLLAILGSLVGMTIVDAKTFTIPLPLPWFATAVALVIHPLHALWVQYQAPRFWQTAVGWTWTFPTPHPAGWWGVWWVGAAIGGVLGLVVANVLVSTGLIRRSFADYEEWEQATLEEQKKAEAEKAPEAGLEAESSQAAPAASSPELWTLYPHARREMVHELAFLAPCVVLGMVGGVVARNWVGYTMTPVGPLMAGAVPLWLSVLAGVLMGYLIGGGVVWATRIFGSLGFGKEAMGLGDVHLMAAVGACCGWIDATLAFFGAAFVGVAWALLGSILRGAFRRAMPYGPFLAVATVLVLLCKPQIESGISALLGRAINLP